MVQEISQMFFGKISKEAYPNGGFSECKGQPSLRTAALNIYCSTLINYCNQIG